jgi:hypothetical protein
MSITKTICECGQESSSHHPLICPGYLSCHPSLRHHLSMCRLVVCCFSSCHPLVSPSWLLRHLSTPPPLLIMIAPPSHHPLHCCCNPPSQLCCNCRLPSHQCLVVVAHCCCRQSWQLQGCTLQSYCHPTIHYTATAIAHCDRAATIAVSHCIAVSQQLPMAIAIVQLSCCPWPHRRHCPMQSHCHYQLIFVQLTTKLACREC